MDNIAETGIGWYADIIGMTVIGVRDGFGSIIDH
jgi:hypothetical protein